MLARGHGALSVSHAGYSGDAVNFPDPGRASSVQAPGWLGGGAGPLCWIAAESQTGTVLPGGRELGGGLAQPGVLQKKLRPGRPPHWVKFVCMALDWGACPTEESWAIQS